MVYLQNLFSRKHRFPFFAKVARISPRYKMQFFGCLHWGKEFFELYTSDYLTAEEKARLERNAGYTGILPQNYYKDPIGAQERLKRNKAILKKREREAKKNNGKFSADEMIENFSAK